MVYIAYSRKRKDGHVRLCTQHFDAYMTTEKEKRLMNLMLQDVLQYCPVDFTR